MILLTEIATKETTGKLSLKGDDVLQAFADLELRVMNFAVEHSLEAMNLPRHYRSPFDRQIIAQGLTENMPAVTIDQQFSSYKTLTVISES